MKRTSLYLLLLFIVPSIGSPALAARTVYCTNCSTRLVQAIEKSQSYQQMKDIGLKLKEAYQQTIHQFNILQQEIAQYQNMIQNTIQLPASVIAEVKGKLAQLAALSHQIKTFRGDITSLGQAFTALFPGQASWGELSGGASDEEIDNFNQRYRYHWEKWSKNVDDAEMATFQLSGAQLQAMQQDAKAFDAHLDTLLSTPDGQMKALMAGNQLATLQIQESRQLRELMATYVQGAVAKDMKAEKESQVMHEQWKRLTNSDGMKGRPIPSDPF